MVPVIFGEEGDVPVLGARSLEALGVLCGSGDEEAETRQYPDGVGEKTLVQQRAEFSR